MARIHRRAWIWLALLPAALSLVVSGSAAASETAIVAATWPQFGHDPRLSGANPEERVITRDTVANLNLEYVGFGPADPSFGGISQSSPAVVGNVAYVGTNAGQLLALPAAGCGSDQCQPLWTAQLSNGVFTTPAVANGLVFIASAGSVENGLGTLYAFKAAGCGRPMCAPTWTAPVPSAGTPTVADGVLYIVAGDGRLLAFTAAGCGRTTCDPLWSGNIKSSALAAPAVANGLVYATSAERLIAFRAAGCGQKECRPVWASIPVAGSDTGSGLIQGVGPTVSGDKVYFASVDFQSPDGKTSTIYAYAAAGCISTDNLNCPPLWVAHPSDFDSIQANLTVANGVLYGSAVGFVFAFDANGCGKPVCGFLWFGILPGTIAGTEASPSIAGGVVYYTQNNGQIGGFDARGCGEIECFPLWSTLTQPFEAFMTTPVIVNGRLYVAGPAVGAQPTMWVYNLTH
jgi:outer membrane protein assembly factor BamB